MDSSLRRVALITAVIVGAAIPFSFAADLRRDPGQKTHVPARARSIPTLVVPNVKGQAYVVAQEILEEAGLAWFVTTANGFPGNTVVGQSPRPGTRIADTGAPLIRLQVKRNRVYPERGIPDNKSPYRGTGLRIERSS